MLISLKLFIEVLSYFNGFVKDIIIGSAMDILSYCAVNSVAEFDIAKGWYLLLSDSKYISPFDFALIQNPSPGEIDEIVFI